MDQHVVLVFTECVDGAEEEFRHWYENVHFPEVLATKGFTAARGYELSRTEPPQSGAHRWLAIYEVEGDLGEAIEELAAGASRRQRSGAMDATQTVSHYYTQYLQAP